MKRKIFANIITLGMLLVMVTDCGWAKEEETQKKNGLFRGSQMMLLMPNFDDLDKAIGAIGYPAYGESSIFLIGGGGYEEVGKSIRIGGFGGSSLAGQGWGWGKKRKEGNKESDLKMGFGGIILEHFMSTETWNFALGGMIGVSSIDLHFTDSATNDLIRFKDVSLLYGPLTEVQYQINKKVSLEACLGYLFWNIKDGEWTGTNLSPKRSMDMSGPLVRIGVIFTEKSKEQ